MALINAFEAYRLQEKWADEVAAQPYDVMSVEEAGKMAAGHPYSFLNIDKPEINIKEGGETSYLLAAHKLQEMITSGIYKRDSKSFYIYELESSNAHQYGLVALTAVSDYQQGIIKKHENTRSDKEEDRVQHILHCKAHTGPVFLVEDALPQFGKQLIDWTVSHKPIIDVTYEDGITHRIYQISDPSVIEKLTKDFEKVSALYIADGHHRGAAACRVAQMLRKNEAAQSFLAVIFPKEQLHILSYHRVLKDESGLSKDALFEKLKAVFEIKAVDQTIYRPKQRHIIGMRYQKKWYALTVKPEIYEGKGPSKVLDVAILQEQVLAPLFGIQDPKSDPRIDFIPGIRPIETLNERTEKEMDLAFAMYPTSMDELLAVADSHELMPPKSTWFEPKLRSGFFIHCF